MTPEALTAIMVLVSQVSGTSYVPGGNSPAGTDCSGLASWVANVAVGRDPYSGRFTTANEAAELAPRRKRALAVLWRCEWALFELETLRFCKRGARPSKERRLVADLLCSGPAGGGSADSARVCRSPVAKLRTTEVRQ